MSNHLLRASFVGLAALALTAACGGARAAGAPARADTAAVRAALGASVAAWNRGDLEGHVAVYADSATLLPAPPGGAPGRGRADARRNFAPLFAAPAERPALQLADLTLRALGPGRVLAAGRWVLVGGRVAGPRTGWFTEVWERTPAGWRIVHDHSG